MSRGDPRVQGITPFAFDVIIAGRGPTCAMLAAELRL
jgi:hypothetical protein